MDYAKWANKEIDRIAEPRARTETVVALAERLEITKSTMYVYLRGEQPFSTQQVDIMAEFFGVESPARPKRGGVAQVVGNVVHFLPPPAKNEDDDGWITYPVLGVTHAGSFREPDELTQPSRHSVQGERSARYPNATPMAWDVCDDSMNQNKIFAGTTVMGVDFHEAGGILENDMIVVVERARGGMIERSVKLVAVYPDRIEFQPKSSDPVHKSFIYNDGRSDEDTEIRVLTIVTATYRSAL